MTTTIGQEIVSRPAVTRQCPALATMLVAIALVRAKRRARLVVGVPASQARVDAIAYASMEIGNGQESR